MIRRLGLLLLLVVNLFLVLAGVLLAVGFGVPVWAALVAAFVWVAIYFRWQNRGAGAGAADAADDSPRWSTTRERGF